MNNEIIEHEPLQVGESHVTGMNRELGRYQPRSFGEVVTWAKIMSEHGGFLKSLNNGAVEPMTPPEICLIVAEGDELGLTPVQSLREISLFVDRDGRKRTIVGYKVLAARIQADPRTIMFDVDTDESTYCTIKAQRKGRDPIEITTKWDDLSTRDQGKHATHKGDILFGRCVRKLGRRGFADMLLGLYIDDSMDARVIDVATVERTVGREQAIGKCEECGKPTYLRPSRNGGVFSECDAGHRQSPPPAVRDAVRGKASDFVVDADARELPESSVDPAAGNGGRDLTPEEAADLEVPDEPASEQAHVEDDALDEVSAVQADEEPVDKRSVAEQFHDNIAEVVLNYIAGTKGEKRAQAITAITNFGWTSESPVGTWVRKLTSESLTLLVEQFNLKVSIKGELEANVEERSAGTDSTGPIGEGVAVGVAGSSDRAADAG